MVDSKSMNYRERGILGAEARWGKPDFVRPEERAGHTAHYRKIYTEAYGPPEYCEMCGEPYQVIHHIDENHFNDEPDNLAALCRSCHVIVHRTGQKDSLETLRKRVASWRRWWNAMTTEEREIEHARRQEVGRQLKKSGKLKGISKHSKFGILQSVAQQTTRMRRCSNCDKECNAGGMASHCKNTGHTISDWRWSPE